MDSLWLILLLSMSFKMSNTSNFILIDNYNIYYKYNKYGVDE